MPGQGIDIPAPWAGQQTGISKSDHLSPVLFTAALLKVASRCNLDCDYCYVYKHADQSWRSQPRFMAAATIREFARRLREYTELHRLPDFSVTFHGGEPLLFGGFELVAATEMIREIVGTKTTVSFSLQTNGTLLTDHLIGQFEAAKIDVSVSLDGPRWLHDRHRPNHAGNSTFDATLQAIQRLRERNSPIFSGVIAVIDPDISPRELLEFFARLSLPRLDLLLPDSTHDRPPPRRDKTPTLYVDWLQDALSLWFSEFSELPIRWFDALLASRVGIPSATDAMGLGAVNLIVIDTDGSYADHDVFKITTDGRASLKHTLAEKSFDEISRHPVIRDHCFRLTLEGLPTLCQSCPAVDACGGGSVMHRWHPEHGLDAPSIFCPELFAVLQTATKVIRGSLPQRTPCSAGPSVAIDSGDLFLTECSRWRAETEDKANGAADRLGIRRMPCDSAAALILSERFESSRKISATSKDDGVGTWLGTIKVQSDDSRLIAPFLESVRPFPRDSVQVKHGMAMLEHAAELLWTFDITLPKAFAALISDVLFVESTVESQDSIFSFSDDSSPNVVYVAPCAGGKPLGADDLCDSLLHEFLHQVLYHMERDAPMLHDHVFPRFPAPWRAGLRPAGGFLHGTFVFSGLSRYWSALARSTVSGVDIHKANANATRFREQAQYGIKSLQQFALLTTRGEALLLQLATSLGVDRAPMPAPYLTTAF